MLARYKETPHAVRNAGNQHWSVILSEQAEDDIFLQHKKRSEKHMRVAVALLVAFFIFTLWFLLSDEF